MSELRINADFNERVIIRPENYQWLPSPAKGVERMMLDRIGNEIARATSFVRYAPNTQFSEHTHGGGEEFIVLDGVFSDEHGDYPAGTYVRHPAGSSHAPKIGSEGAIIWVKLQQFSKGDKESKVIDTNKELWQSGLVDGLQVMPLHQFEGESVALVKWAPYTQFSDHRHYGGEEILVLEGVFRDESGVYPKGSWIRSPHISQHNPYTDSEGALILVKVGHLPLDL